jgi:hypothetical protein
MASGCELEGIPGVGPATAKRLREAQLTTLESVAVATAHELSQAGIEYHVAEKITQKARVWTLPTSPWTGTSSTAAVAHNLHSGVQV